MEQEKLEKNIQEIQDPELQGEKTKKIFIIFIVLLLFGFTCYYYAGTNKSHLSSKYNLIRHCERSEAIHQPMNIKRIASSQAPRNDDQTLIVSSFEKNKLEKIQKTEKLDKNSEKIIKAKTKPTGKSALLALGGKISGKNDPFSYSESKFIPFEQTQGENQLTPSSGLPPAPGMGSLGNLPSIPGFPGANPIYSNGLNNPPASRPEDSIMIKGFIGNKVIAEINGVVESLNENEKISNIKVLKVNSALLTAKFEINGKTFTKTMTSLYDDNNPNIELVKNYNY